MAGFVRAASGEDLAPGRRPRSRREKADDFLRDHGDLFGLTDAHDQLEVIGETSDALGTSRVRYRQRVGGIEVFGSELRAHFGSDGKLRSVGGTIVPINGPVATSPTLSGKEAEAVAAVEDHVEALGRKLVIYDTGLLRGVPGSTHLAWEVEIADAGLTLHERVLVDAASGDVLDRIPEIKHAIARKVGETNLSNIIWDETLGDPDPIPAGWASGTADQVSSWNDEIDGARETYNLIGSMTNGAYLSYDGVDAILYSVNNASGLSCPNASWNGISTNYCFGVTSDDIVAHEWLHAYTQNTNNLIYAWQAGALNESYSDIFGELVDLLNGRGTDSPAGLRTADGSQCSSFGSGSPALDESYRWLLGEDSSDFGGAIRDLWQPRCFGHPDRVGSSRYRCSSADNGGVHSNSGIPNHSFALLVDGGTFNGQTIVGIGPEKAAHIYWRAATVYEVPASDFEDHADALEASCEDLIGVPLYAPVTTGPATWGTILGSTISAADCTGVTNAIAAVELRSDPTQCGFTAMLDPNAPALCSGGTVTTVHLQDWESGLGSWTVGTESVLDPSTFDTPDWTVLGTLPDGRPGQAAHVINDPTLGNCSADNEAGMLYLQSPAIVIPGPLATLRLAFDHWHSTEEGWDGGNLKIRVNGGAFQLVPGSAFTFNGYNGSVNTAGEGNDNPLAGEEAFTGSNEGSLTGSWGQSQVDLSAFAGEGDTVELRFELGIDGCNGRIGWYVDDVHLYFCPGEIYCDPTPATGCRQSAPFGSMLTLIDGKKDKIVWRLNRGDATLNSEWLDPSQPGANIAFCLYDDSGVTQPIFDIAIPSGGLCGGKSCWKDLSGKGYLYKEKSGEAADGVTTMKFKPGEQGKTKILVKANGDFLTLPSLPLTNTVTAQLVINDGPTEECWQSTFPFSILNDGAKFKAKGP